jgi:hypothetical protein
VATSFVANHAARKRAAQVAYRAIALVARTALVSQRAQTACAACGHRLNGSSGVLLQGDQPVHARCWRRPKPEERRPPESPA